MGDCKVCGNTRLVVEHWQGEIVWTDGFSQTITWANTVYKSCPQCCVHSVGEVVAIPLAPTIPI